jgi:hypothetical protein
VTASDDELRRRFADLEEALLPQVHAADPAALQRRGRAFRIRRTLVLAAAATLLIAAFTAIERSWLIEHGDAVEPVSPAPRPATTPPSTQQPPTTGAPTSTTQASTSTTPAGFRFRVDPRTARGGQPVTLAGSGCAPGARVGFAWVPADVVPASVGNLPPATTRRDGTFQTIWRLEAGFQPGRYTVTAACAQPKASATAILTVSQQPQASNLRITQPANQSGVTQGTTVIVRGVGCPAGSRVQLAFNGQLLATVTAQADGSFQAPVRIPVYRIDPTQPESSEAELTATCDQHRDVVIVAVNAASQP